MTDNDGAIQSVLQEDRVFDPPADFIERCGGAWVESKEQYQTLHEQSIEDPEHFWGAVAEELHWFKKWDKVLEWECPDARWFVGGRINACWNCVDRHVENGFGDQTAIIWEGEPVGDAGPEVRRLTYADMQVEVSRFANALKKLGVQRGDIVTIYMGMVPELAIAVLACARIGAPHSVIFGGFSAQSIADRVTDAGSKFVITCDGAWRRGSVVELKANVDEALSMTDLVEQVVVVRRCENEIDMHAPRDVWWHDVVADVDDTCPCEEMDSEDMLFLLYTSGSTGKPKGIVHTTAGYLVHTFLTSRYTFNLRHHKNHVYWCTADVGWITGHSYIIYGIMQNGIPSLMYEGAPNHPGPDRFWDICQRHEVTHFYTAPTAIRAFMKWGEEHPRRHDLSKLEVLGTVGEPINPEAWMWYHRVIGHERCPIVDTWWQTETGGHMITPLPAATPTVPGSCTLPFLGIDAAVVDESGAEQPHGSGGLLVVRKPWPSMLRGIHGDRQRFIDTYFSRVDGMYFAGDSARRDERGYFWIMGRMDDVINVSGHRLGTMEVESALVSHDSVVEAAVVGMPHEIKGTGIAAFCTLSPDWSADDRLRDTLRAHVAEEIGAIAKPDMIRFTDALPKTRSGKIMRRLLRDVAAGREAGGDMTTLEDLSVLARLQDDED
ncbi:MAG: acetate--CoA ligase [Phycisphaerales bacterium]|nr:acetate--CoA ligase [Phycisphaerales bacterium]